MAHAIRVQERFSYQIRGLVILIMSYYADSIPKTATMTVEYLNRKAELNFVVDCGSHGAIGIIVSW